MKINHVVLGNNPARLFVTTSPSFIKKKKIRVVVNVIAAVFISRSVFVFFMSMIRVD